MDWGIHIPHPGQEVLCKQLLGAKKIHLQWDVQCLFPERSGSLSQWVSVSPSCSLGNDLDRSQPNLGRSSEQRLKPAFDS